MQGELDYRRILRSELEERCRRNPHYSLRSFARDLEIAPARLSDVLRGRYGLSAQSAKAIGHRLNWSARELEYFCELVEANHARSVKSRTQAKKRLEQLSKDNELSLDNFQAIAEWYHYGLMELMLTADYQDDPQWMAKRLGINPVLVQPALERMERLRLIERKGNRWRVSEDFTSTPSDVPSAALKHFHQQIMARASQAVALQAVEARDFSTIVMAFERGEMAEAKKMIREFRRAFDARFARGKKRKNVYALSIQFFQLDEEGKK